jgi:hypothetical protein
MAPVKPKSPKTPGRSMTDFQGTHDKNVVIPAKIKAALAAIGEEWRYEQEFLKEAGISINDLGRFRDQFDGHMVVVRTRDSKAKSVWFGTTANADKAREMDGVS